jgi:hypothetical protein
MGLIASNHEEKKTKKVEMKEKLTKHSIKETLPKTGDNRKKERKETSRRKIRRTGWSSKFC